MWKKSSTAPRAVSGRGEFRNQNAPTMRLGHRRACPGGAVFDNQNASGLLRRRAAPAATSPRGRLGERFLW